MKNPHGSRTSLLTSVTSPVFVPSLPGTHLGRPATAANHALPPCHFGHGLRAATMR
jgi:hypothetical protein